MSKKHAGFTLIEFSIVMMIFGTLLVAGLGLYKVYQGHQSMDSTYERLYDTNTMLAQFQSLSSQKRYPCPADPTMPIGNASYGLEVCPPDGAAVGSCWTLAGGSVVTAADGVCVGAGGVDTGLDADTDPTNDTVLLGMYPYKSVFDIFSSYIGSALLLDQNSSARLLHVTSSAQSAIDGWSRQFTYIVTTTMTKATTFEKRSGSVKVIDEGDQQSTRDGIHYVLISHGQNGLGAYTSFGIKTFACPAGTKDFENCNGDGIVVRPIVRTYVSGANLLDDIMVYKVYVDSELWAKTACSIGSDDTSCIYNKNTGYVGIGSTAATPPLQKLDVAGNIRAEASKADLYCDKSNGYCFDANIIGGSGMFCDQSLAHAGKIMVATAIKNSELVCTEVNKLGSVTPNQFCPANQFIIGFNSLGGILCGPLE